jgi:hypothetical protein
MERKVSLEASPPEDVQLRSCSKILELLDLESEINKNFVDKKFRANSQLF